MKNVTLKLASLVIIVFVLSSCSKVITPLYDTSCPFRMLNFSAATEKDSIKNTLVINDSLVASLEGDLTQLKKNGKVGNNLVVTTNRLKILSQNKKLDVTNEYFQFFNNKTTALCGLNDLLLHNKILRNPQNRERAETMLLDLAQALGDYSQKKKLETSTTN